MFLMEIHMEYSRIPIILKRYSFASKMAVCQLSSRKIMNYTSIDIHSNRDALYPWELETFALFSLMTIDEYDSRIFKNQNDKQLVEIFNAIRNYEDPKLRVLEPNMEFANRFLMVTGQLQFKPQADIRNRFFRYNYLFSFINETINVKDAFIKKFGCQYDEYYKPAMLLYFFFSLKPMLSNVNSILDYIVSKHRSILSNLTITREKLCYEQLSKLDRGLDSYYYGFKYLYPHPIVEHDGAHYIPLPYLLVDATTESLMTKLTWENDNLRNAIGKEAVQSYLLYILSESKIFDDVKGEFEYQKGKQAILTPDVLAYKNDVCVLFDSKSSIPKLKLREFDDDSIIKTIEQYTKNVIQIYNRIKDFDLYNPFNEESFVQKNLFGIVVQFEDSYIMRHLIYEEVQKQLGLESDCYEYRFIQSNIKVVDLKEIEDAVFSSYDYVSSLIKQRDDASHWNDITFCYRNPADRGKETTIDPIRSFYHNCSELYESMVHELVEAGIVPKS